MLDDTPVNDDDTFEQKEQVAEMLMRDFENQNTEQPSPLENTSSSVKEDDPQDETLPYEFSVKKDSSEPYQDGDLFSYTAASSEAENDDPEDAAEIITGESDYLEVSLDMFDDDNDEENQVEANALEVTIETNITSPPAYDAQNDRNILEEICEKKRKHIDRQKVLIPEERLKEYIPSIEPPRGFLSAINSKIVLGQNALIAEIKKASPSKGIIRQDFSPESIAKSYEEGGAACVSVLTDSPYFQGRDEYIDIVHRSCKLPILRKDFILDPYQITESRALGADCILLIMAAISDAQAAELEDKACSYGMDVLIEVHNEEELQRALLLKSMLIGINNRDLKTLQIDISTTERLAPMVPSPRTVICESGIYSHEDIKRINEGRVRAFLVGESLMVQNDIKLATEQLLGTSI